MADITIQIDEWWTDTQEVDDSFVYDLIEANTTADPSAHSKGYRLTSMADTYREYSCDWDGNTFTVRIEVV